MGQECCWIQIIEAKTRWWCRQGLCFRLILWAIQLWVQIEAARGVLPHRLGAKRDPSIWGPPAYPILGRLSHNWWMESRRSSIRWAFGSEWYYGYKIIQISSDDWPTRIGHPMDQEQRTNSWGSQLHPYSQEPKLERCIEDPTREWLASTYRVNWEWSWPNARSNPWKANHPQGKSKTH